MTCFPVIRPHLYLSAGQKDRTEVTEFATRSHSIHVRICGKCGRPEVSSLHASPWMLLQGVADAALR